MALLHNAATHGDEQMAKVPGLSRRGSVWQFRVRVPEKLKTTIGKGEIVKSLGAVSHAEAARLAYIERAEAEKSFADAERFQRTEPAETSRKASFTTSPVRSSIAWSRLPPPYHSTTPSAKPWRRLWPT